MDALLDTIKTIERRLSCIEKCLVRAPNGVSQKRWYSCREVADLTTTEGVTAYRPFTIRYACNDGRIPEAEKLDNGTWTIPRDAVERILREGLAPERRNGRS